MSTYNIKTLQPSPSMMHDKTVFNGTYQEAVAAAIEQWKATGRSTSLYSGTYGTYWYYRIDADGNATDRNQPGGETHHVHELARQEVA